MLGLLLICVGVALFVFGRYSAGGGRQSAFSIGGRIRQRNSGTISDQRAQTIGGEIEQTAGGHAPPATGNRASQIIGLITAVLGLATAVLNLSGTLGWPP